MPKKRKKSIAILTFLLLLISGTAIVLYLKEDTKHAQSNLNPSAVDTTTTAEPTASSSDTNDVAEVESSSDSTTSTLATVPLNISSEHANDVHSLSSEQIGQLLSDIQPSDYENNLLEAQKSIVDAIAKSKQDPAELGYLFLPKKPAETSQLQEVKQLDVPLYLQKDPKWRTLKYGSDTTQQLGENGCAILSLSMVHAYYNPNENVTPQTILDWSQDRYYVHNQGTSWNIFYDFAQQFGYKFMNYGDNFDGAMQAINNGEVVIATVKPGLFTEFGHILVVRGYQDGNVYVNDPNDDPSKMFSIKAIPASTMLQDGVNYWALSK